MYNFHMEKSPLADPLQLLDFWPGFHINLSGDMLWNIFTLFFIFYVFMTLIFVYHWHRYDVGGGLLFVGEVIYFVGSLLLMVTAGMAVSAY